MPASRAIASIDVPRSPCFRNSRCAASKIASRLPVADFMDASLNGLNEYHMFRSIATELRMADLVLLTGISGFLGGHVGLALLKAGYRVRGSVRDLGKTEKVRTALARAGADMNQLEFVQLDLNSDAGWNEAMGGVRYLQ